MFLLQKISHIQLKNTTSDFIWGLLNKISLECCLNFSRSKYLALHTGVEIWNLNQKSEFWKYERIGWRCHHFTQVHQILWSYDVQFLRHRVRQIEFFVILDHFLTWKIKILKIWRKHFGISLFYTCTKNHNNMMFASECNR